MERVPFYNATGLKFSCKRCSACCRHDPGFVFLSEKDLESLCSFLKTDKNTFIKKYCHWGKNRQTNDSLSLKEKPNNDCIFWDSVCIVYDARPLQCRTFPFWDSVVSSKSNWDITSRTCKGMNTGKTYTYAEIEEFLNQRVSQPFIKRKENIKIRGEAS